MDQHPIPRQITTFEFKLIGFMTLKQFLYLLVFFPLGFVVYSLFPLPLVNIFLGIIVALIGVAIAFVPIQDRPVDVWLKNFIKRLNSPTQYMYQKNNQSLYFLKKLYFVSDPHKVISHVESQEKLSAYLQQTTQQAKTDAAKKARIQNILRQPGQLAPQAAPVTSSTQPLMTTETISHDASIQQAMPTMQAMKTPFLTGVVKNNRQLALPGIMIYIKDEDNHSLRLLKTNPHGIFATYSPLPPGDYLVDIKDPSGNHFFDTMKIHIESKNDSPFEFFSKELL